jgi:hypothetical protein
VVTRAQLDELGLAPAAIARWIEDKRLHRVYPVSMRSVILRGRRRARVDVLAPPPAALEFIENRVVRG